MKFLISAYTGLGNFVLKTPMIKSLKALYPHSTIDLIAGNNFGTEYLLQGSPLINKTHILKENASILEKLVFFRQLRQEKYDLIFLPFDANRHFLLVGSYIAGIKKRIRHIDVKGHGIRPKLQLSRKFFFYPDTTFIPILPSRHEIDLNYDLLEAFENRPIERHYHTFVQVENNTHILEKRQLQAQQYIVIQAGAANGKYQVKVWPPTHFVALIKALLQQYPYPIVLVGDQGDHHVSIQPILQHFPNEPRLLNTAGQTNIQDMIQLLQHSRLVICHDSGVMHIADALAKPLIALYGPTDHTRTRPLKPSSTLLFSEGPYQAAMYHFNTTEAELQAKGIGHQAMQGISVQTLVQTIQKIIQIQA